MKKTILLAAFTAVLSTGCSSGAAYSFCSFGNLDTQVKSYRKEHDYKKVFVDEVNGLGTLICNEFKKNNVECATTYQVFSPLESYSVSDLKKALSEQGFDSILMIREAGDQTNQWNGGSFSAINADTSGNSITGSVTTTNITGYSRNYALDYVIYNATGEEKLYMASTSTSASGTACISQDVFLMSQSEKVVKDILKKGA